MDRVTTVRPSLIVPPPAAGCNGLLDGSCGPVTMEESIGPLKLGKAIPCRNAYHTFVPVRLSC